MNILKQAKSRTAQSDTSRRSFVWKMGGAVSAALAPAVSLAKAEASTPDNPALRAALLEEEKALRKFHQAFAQAMDNGLHEEVIGMFAGDAEVVFNGGVFKSRSRGVSRLYRDRWDGGVYRVNYRKDGAGHWKISRLEYDTLSRADYRSGKSYAQRISVSRFATRFPADQQGPDDLV